MIKVSGIATVAVFGFVALADSAPRAFAQAAQGQPAQGQAAQGQQAQAPADQKKEKKVKDQGEYDLFNAATKEQDPKKKIELLNQWKQKYPDSDFKEDRQVLLLQAYQQSGQPKEILATAKDLLAMNPSNIQALYWIATLVPGMELKDPADLDLGEKAGNGLLNAKKPDNTKEEDWAKAKKDLDALGHKDLGYVALTRNNFEQAEGELKKSLEINPNQAQVASWLGTAIYRQKKPERQSEVLYYFARAAVLEPNQGGVTPPAARKAVEDYLERAYKSFHGEDPQGLQQLKAEAAKSPFPPPNFKIENLNEIAVRKEEEFKKSNPQLALWMGIKKELTAPNGEQYFDSNLKNAAVPKLKGTVISGKPAVNSKELLVGIENPSVPEVSLKLDKPLTGKPKPGNVIEWEGVPTAFSKDPFLLTFDVERAKITGLESTAAPAAKKSGAKKGGARRR